MSNYKNTLRNLAEIFKALSNHHRLEIFLRLASCCPPGARATSEEESRRFIAELAQDLGIAPSTVSHHVKELRRAGLIRVERVGKNIECHVDDGVVEQLTEVLSGRIFADIRSLEAGETSELAGSRDGLGQRG